MLGDILKFRSMDFDDNYDEENKIEIESSNYFLRHFDNITQSTWIH